MLIPEPQTKPRGERGHHNIFKLRFMINLKSEILFLRIVLVMTTVYRVYTNKSREAKGECVGVSGRLHCLIFKSASSEDHISPPIIRI